MIANHYVSDHIFVKECTVTVNFGTLNQQAHPEILSVPDDVNDETLSTLDEENLKQIADEIIARKSEFEKSLKISRIPVYPVFYAMGIIFFPIVFFCLCFIDICFSIMHNL